MTQILNFSVLFFTPFLKQTLHFNIKMIAQLCRLWGSLNGLIFLAIFTNKVQLSDFPFFFFFPPHKRRMLEEVFLVLVMLANYRNSSILDENAIEARVWKLSNPYGLQYMPFDRGPELLKRGEKNEQRETHTWKVTFLCGESRWRSLFFRTDSFVWSAPKLVTQLLMEGIGRDSHGHPHRKATWELFSCPPHINLYKEITMN